MCGNKGKKFVAALYNVLLAPDLCDRLFLIITLMNEGHMCIFHKEFCTVYFGAKEDWKCVYIDMYIQRRNILEH